MKFTYVFCVVPLLLISGCGDGAEPQNILTHPKDRAAEPYQLELLMKVLKNHPSLDDDLKLAEEDGVVTKQELLDLVRKANKLKKDRSG